MAIIGYTPGGSPIFWGNDTPRQKTKKRVLYRCSNPDCTQRTTKNQATASDGKCPHCKAWLRAFKPAASLM